MKTSKSFPCAAILAAITLGSTAPFALAQTGPGYALSFNGSNSYVAVASENIPVGSFTYTIEAWIKPTAMGYGGIVGWGNYGTTNGVNVLTLRPTGVAISWWSNDLAVATNLTDGWHHIAATYDGTYRRLYIDGNLRASGTNPPPMNVLTDTNVTIGKVNVSDHFNGSIDEVRIWSSARAQDQIRTNMYTRLLGSWVNLVAFWRLDEGGGTSVLSATSRNPGTLINSPAWVRSGAPFSPDGTTYSASGITTASGKLNAKVHPGNLLSQAWFQWGTTTSYGTNTPAVSVGPGLPSEPTSLAYDISSVLTNLMTNTTYHFRVAITNAVGTNYGTDVALATLLLPSGPGCALTFDGLDDYGVLNRPVSDDFTLECWFKSTQVAGDGSKWFFGRGLIDGEMPGVVPDFGLTLGGGKVLFGTGGAFDTTIRSGVVADGTWHHLAATRQRSTGTMLLYVDGALVDSGTGSTNSLTAPPTLWLGAMPSGGNFFQGQLDEVRIWNTVRSQAQLQAYLGRPLAGNDPGLVAYLKLYECSGVVAADITGHGYDCTLVNGATGTNSSVPYGPFVLTSAATNLTTTGAALKGSVNAEGFASTAWFEWGTNTAYGNTTVVTNVGSGTNTVTLSTNISVLQSFRTYHFRAVAGNAYGTNYGDDQSFWFGQPLVVTMPAFDIATNAATMDSDVIASGPSAQAWFQWGTTTNYGSNTVQQSVGSGSTAVAFTNRLSGLVAGATYHYRIVATNSFGVDYGDDLSVTTPVLGEIVSSLPGVANGSMVWGDYNNDGYLDVLLTGWSTNSGAISRIYRNNGNGTFTDIGAALEPVYYSSVAWGDYNNDGYLDILLTGWSPSYGYISRVYRNSGPSGFTFSDIGAGLGGVHAGSALWGDYDNDGDLDILLMGWAADEVTHLYRNNGNGTFSELLNTGLPPLVLSSVAWGDYDNDGNLDLLLTGTTNGDATGVISRVYHNNGDGTFTDVAAGLTPVYLSSAAWGDYDNDGDLDILLTGYSGASNVAKIYRNDGQGRFTDIGALLPGVQQSSVAWGDYDNDGYLDFALTGWGDSGATAGLYRNSHNGVFANIATTSLPGVYYSTLAWGDFRNDGRLDLLMEGIDAADNCVSHLYQNYWPITNKPPAAPMNLIATVAGTNAFLSWNTGNDQQTPTPGLSYNLRVATSPGGVNIASPHSLATGRRLVAQLGNMQPNLFANLGGLKYGSNYYWTVQAVDSSFAGSAFANEVAFSISSAPSSGGAQLGSIMGNSAVLTAAVWSNGLPTTAHIEWGTTTTYGNSTATEIVGNGLLRQTLTGLLAGTWYHYRVVTSNSSGTTYGADQLFYVDPGVVLGDANANGVVDQNELDTMLADYWPNSPWLCITNALGLGKTNVTFALSNSLAGAYSVMMTTNLAQPWQYLGPATPRYEFCDTNAPAFPQRYYRLRWP